MSLGMIARCDNGGLGAMTWEFWRHMQPARTLVVFAADRPRGRAYQSRYEGGPGEVRFTPAQPTARDARWLLDGIAALYTAETWYDDRIAGLAAQRGVRTFLHVMPEYFTGAKADTLLVPTSWEPPSIRGRCTTLLPVPVARDRLPVRTVDRVRVLYHIESPEADRNGTELLLAACQHMRTRPTLLIRGHSPARKERLGRVRVEWLGHYDGPYYEGWPAEVDMLVMPRRFAGLSLPMQEAAALGLPLLTLDRAPERDWTPWRVPVTGHERMRIWRNNVVASAQADPLALAAQLDAIVAGDTPLADALAASAARAAFLDWSQWTTRYTETLEAP